MLTRSKTANKHNAALQTATNSVHEETIRIVDEQMKDISVQMQALDDFVTRARSQNAQHHDSHGQSLQSLSTTVRTSYDNIGSHFTSTYERVRDLGEEMSAKTSILQDALSPLDINIRQPLSDLRANITNTLLQDYVPTGETPQKTQYQYPKELPHTEKHETLLAALRRPGSSQSTVASPSKKMPVIFQDAAESQAADEEVPFSFTTRGYTLSSDTSIVPTGGLREIDLNINAGSLSLGALGSTGASHPESDDGTEHGHPPPPPFKRSVTVPPAGTSGLKLPHKISRSTKSSVVPLEGRENSMPIFAQSTGRRRSPRNA